jgi:hypothetical protein
MLRLDLPAVKIEMEREALRNGILTTYILVLAFVLSSFNSMSPGKLTNNRARYLTQNDLFLETDRVKK